MSSILEDGKGVGVRDGGGEVVWVGLVVCLCGAGWVRVSSSLPQLRSFRPPPFRGSWELPWRDAPPG